MIPGILQESWLGEFVLWMYTKCIPHFTKLLYIFCIQYLAAIAHLICIQNYKCLLKCGIHFVYILYIVGWGKNERFLKILFFIRTHELMTSKIYINIKGPKSTIIWHINGKKIMNSFAQNLKKLVFIFTRRMG